MDSSRSQCQCVNRFERLHVPEDFASASCKPCGQLNAAITTIIPTFQRPQLLQRAIRSVQRQTFGAFIVRVCDNASADESASVVAAMAAADPRIEYQRRPVHVGVAANFAAGLTDVATPFFSFLSDDDVLLPSFYETALDAFARHPSAMMFAGATLELDVDGGLRNISLTRWPREGLYEPPETLFRMLDNQYPTWTGVVFRRELLERVGGLDERAASAMDLDYELRVAAHHPIVVSFQPCAAWLVHGGSIYGNESADVVNSFECAIEKIERDGGIDEGTRTVVASRLKAEVPRKLFEVSVKAQIRGDYAASREAALMLRDRFGRGGVSRTLMIMCGLSERATLFRQFLAWLESIRQQMRARRARRSARTSLPLDAYVADVRAMMDGAYSEMPALAGVRP